MKGNFLDRITNLRGKVILITGACGQLGNSLCTYFKNVGCEVIGSDIYIGKKTDGVTYFKTDISKPKQVESLFKKLNKLHKKIDVVINNAGVSTFDPFEERSEKKFDWVFDVNLKGSFNVIQKYVDFFDNNKQLNGNIINIGSMYGVISPDYRIYGSNDRKNSEIYGASKAGIIQITKYFAVHLAERKIRCNSISPGGIYNPDNPQSKNFIREYSKRCPMGRMAETNEISGLVLFMASEISSYINGQNILVDGGMSCW